MTTTINASTSAGAVITPDTSGSLQLQTSGTAAVTIDTSQNVGVGTTSPSTYSTKLAVKASNQDSLLFVGGTTYAVRVGANASFAAIDGIDAATGASSYQPVCLRGSIVLFNTGGTERGRFDQYGNFMVNTNASLNVGRVSIAFEGTAENGLCLKTTNGTTTTSNQFVNFIQSNDVVAGKITMNGANTTIYSTSSDYRLKENIQPMQNALSMVHQLNPVTYTWKADGSAGQGFIAHELQEVAPICVDGEKDAVDDEGKPVYQGVDTSFLVATLTAAIQELSAKVAELEAKVGA